MNYKLINLLKELLLISFLVCFIPVISYSQNASTFFPSKPGYTWYYKNTPLDSLNMPVLSQATYQIDSFAVNQFYHELPASLVLTKSGLTNINQVPPYTDTNYFNFQSTNGYYYLNLLNFIGSIPIIDSLSFKNFLKSLEAWYLTYKIAQTVNTNYTIFSKDTTVTFDSLTLPLRLSLTGRRLNDQTISTVNGNYLTKKFLLTFVLSYGILPPILYIPVVIQPDTIFISESLWVVRECKPSINIDLSTLGFPISFSNLGFLKELTSNTYQPIKVSLTTLMEGMYSTTFNQLTRKDTILVYLRSASPPYTLMDSALASIDSLSYSGLFNFNNAPSGSYYLVVKHFNCMETWSKSGGEYLNTDGSIYNFDFTSIYSQAYGNNLKSIGSKYCIYSGDVNQDGFIDLFDVVPIYNDSKNFITGRYLVTDLNGDNVVDLADMTICSNNSKGFIRVRRP